MISSLLFFILSHQVSIYVIELKFYQEQKEIYDIERMLQKTVKDIHSLVQEGTLQSKEIHYQEGKTTLQITPSSSTQKMITFKIETIGRRKSSVILHYDTKNQQITRWIEGR